MDLFLNTASKLRRRGIPSLSLLAGVLIGIFLYKTVLVQWSGRTDAEPRQIARRGELHPEELRNVRLFEQAAPSVVFITTKARQSWFLQSTEVATGSGSGFVWDEAGHIITNFHVIQGGDAFEVVFHDQSSFDAQVVGIYPDKDLAVLKVDAPRSQLRPLPLGTTKGLKVGQMVMAIGNPFGLDHSLSTGVVSALDRTLEGFRKRKIEGVIQTDAAINPGNSGGPLLDSAGRLIGVNTQIYSTSGSSAGIGFAIPVDTVNEVVPDLIKFGKVIRPGFGITVLRNNDRATQRLGVKGLVVYSVQPGGSADRAGIRGISVRRNGDAVLGDIVTKVEGQPVAHLEDLQNLLDKYKVGDKVEVTLIRDGLLQAVEIELQALN